MQERRKTTSKELQTEDFSNFWQQSFWKVLAWSPLPSILFASLQNPGRICPWKISSAVYGESFERLTCSFGQKSGDTVFSCYNSFAEAFVRVLYYELLKKVSGIGVGGFFLTVLFDYLDLQAQHIRVVKTFSRQLEITNGMPQGSPMGPLFLCIFLDDHLETLKLDDSYIIIDVLKIIAIAK